MWCCHLTLPRGSAHVVSKPSGAMPQRLPFPSWVFASKTAVGGPNALPGAGFRGIITKPIDCAELKTKVCRALKLETSYKYFQQRDGTLVLTLPKDFHPGVAQDVISGLGDQLTATVNAGGDKLIVDLTSVASATLPVIELLLSTVRACGELSLRHAMVGSETMRKECLGYEEAAAWFVCPRF